MKRQALAFAFAALVTIAATGLGAEMGIASAPEGWTTAAPRDEIRPQFAFESKPYYVIEVISECFDILNQQEQEKVLIHELLHVPGNFGGGFRHHGNWVNRQRVERVYEILQKRRQSKYLSA